MFNEMLIYKDNLINNIKQVKKENLNSKICAMVKANAYGVGLEHVVPILEEYVDFFGVACFFEAKKVATLSNKKILICGPLEKNEIDDRFSYACESLEDVLFLISLNKKVNIHLKINSGMNRYGFKCLKDLKKVLKIISGSNLFVEGVFTHFATVDEFVDEQMKKFKKFVHTCYSFGFNPIVHADNSFVNEKYNHDLDMARIGFSLYNRQDGWFLPATEIKSCIVNVCDVEKNELVGYNYKYVAKKNIRVGIVPIGYADGFVSKFVGKEIVVDGAKCKVLNVCMDCFMLDISKTELKKGDELFILNKFNSLKSYAEHAEINEYEVMTNFSRMRAKRILV